MNCPKCKTDMETVQVEAITVDRCRACSGLWFDLRELDRLRASAGARQLDRGTGGRTKADDARRRLDCPHCQTPMVSMVFPDQAHIHYEMCSVCHGLYLDAGEFQDLTQTTLAERVQYAIGHLFE